MGRTNGSKVKRHLALRKEASDTLDELAKDSTMNLGEIVSEAILEYSDRDRLARVEGKVDNLLEELGASQDSTHASGVTPVEKKKNSQAISDFDPLEYDPDEFEGTLSKDGLEELIQLEEPEIALDHVDTSDLPGNTDDKATVLAATLRHENDKFVFQDQIVDRISETLGNSYYYHNTYDDLIASHFDQFEDITQGEDGFYTRASEDRYFVTEEVKLAHYRTRFNDTRESASGEIAETSRATGPLIDLPREKPYPYYLKWLNEFSGELVKHDIATSDEIATIKRDLASSFSDVRDSIADLIDLASRSPPHDWFEYEEAVDMLEYNDEQARDLLETLDEWAYIAENADRKDHWKVVAGNLPGGEL
ncbi:hypothetical protein [Haloterrigena salifodinae]|uniref:hypothetical protein n=1 Tax=Haloterrigena salifodinae TaxID=2675099 RepID=UPI000F8748A7|nr:hypothetical protein [Haloterrigena salifodinae]